MLRILARSGLMMVLLSQHWAFAQSPLATVQGSTPVTVYLTIAAKKKNVPLSGDSMGLSATIDRQPAQLVNLRPANGDKLVYAVLLDNSTSDAREAKDLKAVAAEIFRSLADRGAGYCGVFSTTLSVSERPLSPSEVDSALAGVRFGGGTALFDAIWQTSSRILSRSRNPGTLRRVLVLISDGDDNQSHVYETSAIEQAEMEGISIFSLTTSNSSSRGWKTLDEVSRETGGKVVRFDGTKNGIGPLLAAIDGQWAMSINVAQAPDRKLHSFTVQSTKPGLSVTAPVQIPLP